MNHRKKHKKPHSHKKKMTKKEIRTEIKNFILIILGSIVLGFGTGVFLVPFNIIAGGVTGIGIALESFLAPVIPASFHELLAGFSLNIMDFYVAVLTWIMFFAGLFILGKNFAIKTLLSSIFYPIFFTLARKVASNDVLDGFFNLKNSPNPDLALLLAAICGGALVGAGCAITFLGGGSTGGVDIIALSICKFFKRLKSSVVIFIVDASVIVLGVFALKNFTLSLIGVASAMVCAIVIDNLFVGSGKAFKAEIISPHAEKINELVRRRLNRTTTFIDVIGGYSGERKKMVMLTFTIREYSEVLNIINTVDRDAFVTISSAHEINGEGWTFNTKKDRKSRGQLEQEKKQNAGKDNHQ